ncbi:MAG: tripartite tricarboxylate transporter substrate binding protein [Trueperaceae bacterium]|nr:tripartite tricarboxylate transporter substrate binding protein [Trueperaceae bacterium]
MKRFMGAILAIVVWSLAFAQFSPKNTECIAPADPGGGWDFTCRVPAAQVMAELGLIPGSMKVTNMTGGGGGVAYANVVTQRADDENLIIAASTATATRLAQNVFAGFTADNVRWLGAVGADYGVIAVSNDSPYQTLNDLVDAVAAAPGDYVFAGGSAIGGWDHLKVLLVMNEAGVEDLGSVRYVAFDGGGAAMIEVLGGRAAAFTGDISEVLAQVEAGEIRVLGVLSPDRVPALPEVATATEQGYNVIGANWRAFYAPPGISDEAYNFWVDAIKQVAASEEWNTLREQNGLAEFALFGDDFEGFVRDQVAIIHGISEDLGLLQ